MKLVEELTLMEGQTQTKRKCDDPNGDDGPPRKKQKVEDTVMVIDEPSQEDGIIAAVAVNDFTWDIENFPEEPIYRIFGRLDVISLQAVACCSKATNKTVINLPLKIKAICVVNSNTRFLEIISGRHKREYVPFVLRYLFGQFCANGKGLDASWVQILKWILIFGYHPTMDLPFTSEKFKYFTSMEEYMGLIKWVQREDYRAEAVVFLNETIRRFHPNEPENMKERPYLQRLLYAIIQQFSDFNVNWTFNMMMNLREIINYEKANKYYSLYATTLLIHTITNLKEFIELVMLNRNILSDFLRKDKYQYYGWYFDDTSLLSINSLLLSPFASGNMPYSGIMIEEKAIMNLPIMINVDLSRLVQRMKDLEKNKELSEIMSVWKPIGLSGVFSHEKSQIVNRRKRIAKKFVEVMTVSMMELGDRVCHNYNKYVGLESVKLVSDIVHNVPGANVEMINQISGGLVEKELGGIKLL